MQNPENQNTTKQILTQDKINVELMKIMTEKKTIKPSFKNKDSEKKKKIKVDTEKLNYYQISP